MYDQLKVMLLTVLDNQTAIMHGLAEALQGKPEDEERLRQREAVLHELDNRAAVTRNRLKLMRNQHPVKH
jgi:hypothetical protein